MVSDPVINRQANAAMENIYIFLPVLLNENKIFI